MMTAVCTRLLVGALALAAEHGLCQEFYYAEPGVTACAAAAGPSTAAPKAVSRGVALPGRIHVTCGLDKGSYTLSLNSTDPGATFWPKTFVVNFGRVVGNGVFAVTFSTVGLQSVSIAVTSNMGSPSVQGHFVSPASEFKVATP